MRMGRRPIKSVYSHTSSFLSLNRGLTCFLKEASNALTSGCIMALFPQNCFGIHHYVLHFPRKIGF